MPAPTLSASIVTFQTETQLFARALASLAAAIDAARRAGELSEARLVIIDNGPPETRRDVA
ncbi:MAG: glycosyltransferase family 2 protein, partial [Burkholderia sp.]|nr:glycosyltransferase family 2 protein [Burkholderia sp.]